MSGARPWLRSESMRSLAAADGATTSAALPRGELLVRVEAEGGQVAAAPTCAPSACTRPAPRRRPPRSRASARRRAARTPACRPGSRRCARAAGRVVRSLTAAAAAAGSRFSVRGSMSQNTGRAFSYSRQLADATKLKGEVTTSSPALDPGGADGEVEAGGAARDRARRARRPSRAARARSNSGSARAERELPGAQRVEHRALLRLADQRARERDRLAHAVTCGRGRPARVGSMPASSESTSASQLASMMFSDTPIEPQVSGRRRRRAARA